MAVLTLAIMAAGCGPSETSSSNDCAGHFATGMAPQVVNQRMQPRTTLLCFEAYSVLFSGLTRTPLWSAERLTRDAAIAGVTQERVNDFHEESRLSAADRSLLSDYSRSGYDRGHMTPSADMPTPEAQQESFSLANMVPQAPELNRYSWASLERSVRRLAQDRGEVFVVTGPIFHGADIATLKGRVYVPTSTFKAVYVPNAGAEAFVSSNTDEPETRVMSIADLRQMSGIDPFPALPESVKAELVPLVRAGQSKNYRRRSRSSGWSDGAEGRHGRW